MIAKTLTAARMLLTILSAIAALGFLATGIFQLWTFHQFKVGIPIGLAAIILGAALSHRGWVMWVGAILTFMSPVWLASNLHGMELAGGFIGFACGLGTGRFGAWAVQDFKIAK